MAKTAPSIAVYDTVIDIKGLNIFNNIATDEEGHGNILEVYSSLIKPILKFENFFSWNNTALFGNLIYLEFTYLDMRISAITENSVDRIICARSESDLYLSDFLSRLVAKNIPLNGYLFDIKSSLIFRLLIYFLI